LIFYKKIHIYEYRWMFFYGALTTLGLTVVATAGGSVLGLLLALARMIYLEKAGAPMRALAWVLRKFSLLYVTLFRGTPLFVQIVIWAYVWFPFFVHPTDGLLINGDEAVEIRRSYGRRTAEQRYIQQRNLTQNPSQRAHGRTRLFQMNQARQREQQTQYGAACRRHYGPQTVSRSFRQADEYGFSV
jgi:hypothetical protein